MTCFDIQNRVQELLDHRQRELPIELAAHMTHCAACHDDWQHLLRLHDAREAYVALASQAWQQVSAVDLLLPPASIATPFNGDAATQGVSEPLSRPLAPLGEELRDAVDSLFQQVFNSQDSAT